MINWMFDWLILTAYQSISTILCLKVWKSPSLYVQIHIFSVFIPKSVFIYLLANVPIEY